MEKVIILLIALFLFAGCDKEDPKPEPGFEFGENYFTSQIDGDTRKYKVHVPSSYTEDHSIPVVFMLHGASGTGEITYRNSGWKEVGEDEYFLSVFPTAWSYCWIKNSGVVKDTTRWNSLSGVFKFCEGETPRDDVKFIRTILSELESLFNIDSRRIYMAGFSSGAQMTFRCAYEMNDVFAAMVQSGGTHQIDTQLNHVGNIAISLEIGNEDATWFDNGLYPPLHLFDTLLMNWPLFNRIINNHAIAFGFEKEYSLSQEQEVAMIATFQPIPETDNREFNFILVDGLDHSYPNGFNHSYLGAKHHWNWMKQFSLE